MLIFVLWLLLTGFTTDEGNGFDPHGSPRTSATCVDDGNGLDPHGRPCSQTTLTAETDEGNGLDPHGKP